MSKGIFATLKGYLPLETVKSYVPSGLRDIFSVWDEYEDSETKNVQLWGTYGNMTNIVGILFQVFMFFTQKQESWFASNLTIFSKYSHLTIYLQIIAAITTLAPAVKGAGPMLIKIWKMDQNNEISVNKWLSAISELIYLARYICITLMLISITLHERREDVGAAAYTFALTTVIKFIQYIKKWSKVLYKKNSDFDYLFVTWNQDNVNDTTRKISSKKAEINSKKAEISSKKEEIGSKKSNVSEEGQKSKDSSKEDQMPSRMVLEKEDKVQKKKK